jgi:uncharacterized low-complexity protein
MIGAGHLNGVSPMNKTMFAHIANRRSVLRSAGLASALALALLAPAAALADDAKPTAQEIAKARGECATHKQRVRAMEAAAGGDEQKLSAERLEWEHACGRAQTLIDAATGKTPPAPSAPPADAPNP